MTPESSPPGPNGSNPTLEDAIREGLAPKEAKRLALKLAEAVAMLHARDEVHGELTPRMVLLSRGSAVSILRPEEPQQAMYRMRYASPEAARREELTQASDIFALSLIVRELIEGVPARQGTGDDLVMEAVDGRVSVPHGIEGELVSLAALSSSPHPENRPSASAFAAALKGPKTSRGFSKQDWFVVGSAVVAIGMLAFLLLGSMEERSRSARQSDDARAALKGFIGGIYPELDRVANIEPLAQAGRDALASMEAMLEEERTDADRQLLAQTLLWNGEVQRVRERFKEAKGLFERAVARAESLEDPSMGSAVVLKAQTALGEMATDENRTDDAAKHFRIAVLVGREQINKAANDRENRVALARALLEYGGLMIVVAQGKPDAALTTFRDARRVLDHESLPAGDREVLEILALLTWQEADIARRGGDSERAIQLLRQYVEQFRRIVEMDPGRPTLRKLLAKGADALGGVQSRIGRLPDAVESFRESVETWRLLREMEPEEFRWHRNWAQSTRHLAQLLVAVGEWEEAEALHSLSIKELELLLEDRGITGIENLDVAEQLLEAAEGLHASGDLQDARRLAARARKTIADMTDVDPRYDGRVRSARARAKIIEAELLLSEGDWRRAEQAALSFIDQIQRMAVEGEDRALRVERARALLVTSAVRAGEGDSEAAKGARERCLGIADELIREDPGFVQGYVLKARALHVLGEDESAADVLSTLDRMGYRGLDLAAVRAATAALGQ